MVDDENGAGDSDYASSKKGRKSRGSTKHSSTPSTPAPESGTAGGMPTIEEVCSTFGLTDVELEYTETDFQNLTTYKLFQQHVRPLLTKENPKVPMSKLMMLVAAKWREFSNINPNLQADNTEATSTAAPEQEYIKSSRTRISKEAKAESEAFDEDDDEEDDDDSKIRKKRGSRSKKSSKKASKVPTLKIKLGKRKRGSSEEEGEGSAAGSDRDSDAEFEQMLQEADERKTSASTAGAGASEETGGPSESPEDGGPPVPRRKAKTKFGSKTKKKKTKKVGGKTEDEPYEHQDYCEVCQQGGEIILCDTCPRAYHLVCLEPELEDTPEGKWSCPHCENEGPAEQDDDEHQEFCRLCKDGGELLCCDSCPSAYHTHCLNPPLVEIPDGDWKCPRCSCPPLKARVTKILTWRWVEEKQPSPEAAQEEAAASTTNGTKKNRPKRHREFFVKWLDLSHWHCSWISELQLEVHHPLMWRNYVRKYDMEEPPKLEEPLDEMDQRSKRLLSLGSEFKDAELEETYYKYGVKPEWLVVHRIINHRTMKDGRNLYLVKWRELPYDQATWEEENADIAGLRTAIEYYMDLRAACTSSSSKNKKGKGKRTKTRELMDDDDRTTLRR